MLLPLLLNLEGAESLDWIPHNKFAEYQGDGTVDFDADTFKLGLAAAGSNVNVVTVDGYASITGELPTANGYTAGGQVVAATWVEATGTLTFDVADPQWLATGAGITARYAFIYDDTATGKPILCHAALVESGAVTAAAGSTIKIENDPIGVFTMT